MFFRFFWAGGGMGKTAAAFRHPSAHNTKKKNGQALQEPKILRLLPGQGSS